MKTDTSENNLRIRTPDHRLRVFVSSTLKELAEERKIAQRAIARLHLAPVMFETGARPHLAKDIYRSYLEQSHIFIGIYGEQYGWVGPGMEISGLEEEYRLAEGKPKLIYIRKPVKDRDERLTAMLKNIRDREGISYKYFSSARELGSLIESDLALMLAEGFETAYLPERPEKYRETCHLIPAPATPLIGREHDTARLLDMLRSDRIRLITLTGQGGSGKTRLSIDIARDLTSDYPQVYFVDLSHIRESGLVPDTIAHILGIQEAGAKKARDRLLEFLRERKALLVLDNFEQVADAAVLLSDIIEACPRVRLLVTSRMALNIRGEQEIQVSPLHIPDESDRIHPDNALEYSAIRLFVERAQAIRQEFSFNRDNIAAVVSICRRLEGLPLAIELAAARIRVLSPQAISERLNSQLSLLSGGAKDLPERQQTMRSTIAWSYDLLEAGEKKLFNRLAVFEGGWTYQTAGAVCNRDHELGEDILAGLESLVSKNLVRVLGDRTGETRFGMFDIIHSFARERLRGSDYMDDILADHAAYFVELTEKAEPHMTSGTRDEWIPKLEADLGNLRAVMSRSLSREIDPLFGIRMAGTLGWFWHLRGHLTEGRKWASQLMKMPEASKRDRYRVKVLFPAGGLAWSQGDYHTANTLLQESADIFRELRQQEKFMDAQIIKSHCILAGGLASVGAYEQALGLCRETIELLKATGNSWGIAFTLTWYGAIIIIKDRDLTRARDMFRESLELSREQNDPWLIAESLNHLGIVEGMLGNYQDAHRHFNESLFFHKKTGDRWAVARGLAGLGEIMLEQGNIDQAGDLFRRSLSVWHEMGHQMGIQNCLSALARIAAEAGDGCRAARLYGAAPREVRTVGYLFLTRDATDYQEKMKTVRMRLQDGEWDSARREGINMSPDEAVAYALQ